MVECTKQQQKCSENHMGVCVAKLHTFCQATTYMMVITDYKKIINSYFVGNEQDDHLRCYQSLEEPLLPILSITKAFFVIKYMEGISFVSLHCKFLINELHNSIVEFRFLTIF